MGAPQYCIDPETLNPEVVLSDYFKGCNPDVYTNIIPRFVFPIGSYPYVVAEFCMEDAEPTTETRESRFKIDIAEENYD